MGIPETGLTVAVALQPLTRRKRASAPPSPGTEQVRILPALTKAAPRRGTAFSATERAKRPPASARTPLRRAAPRPRLACEGGTAGISAGPKPTPAMGRTAKPRRKCMGGPKTRGRKTRTPRALTTPLPPRAARERAPPRGELPAPHQWAALLIGVPANVTGVTSRASAPLRPRVTPFLAVAPDAAARPFQVAA